MYSALIARAQLLTITNAVTPEQAALTAISGGGEASRVDFRPPRFRRDACRVSKTRAAATPA
jgi:hypothetical protein